MNNSQIIENTGRGSLPRENNGLPSLDLNEMQGIGLPGEYEIIGVLGDILMCEVIDETDSGEVMRGGIILKQEMVTKMWRVAKVVRCGPQCSPNICVNDLVMYPSDKGIPAINAGKKYVFLNESRIFCLCTPKT